MITGGSVLLLIICCAIYRLTGQGKKKRTARSLPEEIEGTSREDDMRDEELSEAAIEEEGTPDNELSKSEDSELEDFLAVSEEPVAETPDNKTPTADEAAVKDLPESKSVAVTAKFSPRRKTC